MTVIRAPPYPFLLVFVNHLHAVVHLRLDAVAHRFVGLEFIPVEPVQSVPRTQPYETLLVLQDSHHRVLTQPVFNRVVLNDIVLMPSRPYREQSNH